VVALLACGSSSHVGGACPVVGSSQPSGSDVAVFAAVAVAGVESSVADWVVTATGAGVVFSCGL
jgi:hypothetical protein